jgi:hypothetical protein
LHAPEDKIEWFAERDADVDRILREDGACSSYLDPTDLQGARGGIDGAEVSGEGISRSAWQKTPMADSPGPSIDAVAFTIRDPRKPMGAGMNVEPGSTWPTRRPPLRYSAIVGMAHPLDGSLKSSTTIDPPDDGFGAGLVADAPVDGRGAGPSRAVEARATIVRITIRCLIL